MGREHGDEDVVALDDIVSGDIDFGARLNKVLTSYNVSEAELARRIGSKWGHVHNWICGRHQITLNRLIAIKRAIGCSWDELLGE